MPSKRKVIVHIATSADGYIARPDGNIEWLTSRPSPKGFYGMAAWVKTIDTKILGRKTFETALELGDPFSSKEKHIVFSRQAAPKNAPKGVVFTSDSPTRVIQGLREQPGKDIWLMGGGEIIASFLDEDLVDEIFIGVIPCFIGDGIPLIARRHRLTEMKLKSAKKFPDGLMMLNYAIRKTKGR
jgi:dihydrofolate reductase